MDKLVAIIKREYMERVRSKWFFIATLLGPVIMGGLIIIPAYITAKSKPTEAIYNTTILDATKSGLGDRIALSLVGNNKNAHVRPRVIQVMPERLAVAESSATYEVMQRRSNGYLVVDASTVTGESARYAGRSATSIPDMEKLRAAIKQTILKDRLEKAGINPDSSDQLTYIPLSMGMERITEKGRGGSGRVSIFFGFAIGFLLYISIIVYGQNVMRGVLEEKTTRVAEVVISSVRPETLLAGKVIGVGGVGLTQQIIWITAAYGIMKIREPLMAKLGIVTTPFVLPAIGVGTALLLLLFFLLGVTLYSALYAVAGSAVNSEQEAQQIAQPLLLLVVSTGVMIQPVLFNPTSTLATVMSWNPFSAPIIVPLRLAVTTVSNLEVAGILLVLIVTCITVTWIASRIYRVGLLMYGKKPTLREMARWVKA